MKKVLKEKALTETIYSIYGQESIQKGSHLINMLNKARDEAHRFAIKANRAAKRKNMNLSILDPILGLGPKTKERLFKKFKSIDVILNSKEDELLKVKGVNKNIAKEIRRINLK